MLPRVRRIAVSLLLAAMPLLGTGTAHAQVQGACTAEFNGVAVDRIDTLDSPLELRTTDTLVFTGANPDGTLGADVRLLIGPVTVESGSFTYATAQQEFEASISLDDVSPYGVGLFRAVGEADGCVAEAWVRVSGRFPLATLTGLTALGLALGGLTGQLGAIVSRNRWSRSAAALGGIATGTGIAVLAQQFGRLQVSFPSLAAISAIVAVLGFAAAWYLNPTLREERAERRRSATPATVRTGADPTPEPRHAPVDGGSTAGRRPTGERAAPPAASAGSSESTGTSGGSPTADEPAPDERPRDTAPYWCYVMAPTDVYDLQDHTRTVATLVPGTWYLAKRTVGGWAHVVASEGAEGWVAAGAINRHG